MLRIEFPHVSSLRKKRAHTTEKTNNQSPAMRLLSPHPLADPSLPTQLGQSLVLGGDVGTDIFSSSVGRPRSGWHGFTFEVCDSACAICTP